MKEEIIKDSSEKKPWAPTYIWYAKAAGVILAGLIVVFFILNIVLKPYMREIPAEITPWLKKDKPAVGQKYNHETEKMAIIQGNADEK